MLNTMQSRPERTKKWPTAWLLLAILVFVFQPLGMSLFCHTDAGHDHSSHAHPAAAQHDNHSHSHTTAQNKSHAHAALTTAEHSPEHSGETCCSQSDNLSALSSVATSSSSAKGKSAAAPLPVAILTQVFSLEAAPAIQSRAGPVVPSVLSQLRRCSLLNRAPPLSA
jgi:hypothetical protein